MSHALMHTTVLLSEVVHYLAPEPGGVYADLTLGGGGHAQAILEACAPAGRLIGLDRDPVALEKAQARLATFGARATLHHARFSEFQTVLSEAGLTHVHGFVADLGVSSFQLDDGARGFSFSQVGPLDMRMDTSTGGTLLETLATLNEQELADIIYRYGDERASRRIAKAILQALRQGQLHTTEDLALLVTKAKRVRGYSRIHPATQTFQALRIYVNRELDELSSLLTFAKEVLHPKGVVVMISFHSAEDRLVKHAFRQETQLEVLTSKPIQPSPAELARNPRARSAKLRAARRRVEVSE